MSPSSREKTAFSTPSDHWQYRVLPFGLQGAPATFQRLMDVILRPHQEYAAAYLDDVIIHSESWEAHLERLQRVLRELRQAGLRANPRKCHLGLTEAKYLGYKIGWGLIIPEEKKVEAVRKFPRPTNKTQVQAFLGLAGYYRGFIPMGGSGSSSPWKRRSHNHHQAPAPEHNERDSCLSWWPLFKVRREDTLGRLDRGSMRDRANVCFLFPNRDRLKARASFTSHRHLAAQATLGHPHTTLRLHCTLTIVWINHPPWLIQLQLCLCSHSPRYNIYIYIYIYIYMYVCVYICISVIPSFAFDTVSRCLITSMLVHVPSLVVAVVVLFFSARHVHRQACWSRGMILALSAKGPGFKSWASLWWGLDLKPFCLFRVTSNQAVFGQSGRSSGKARPVSSVG